MSTTFAVAFAQAPAQDNPNIYTQVDAVARTNYLNAMVVTLATFRRFHPNDDFVVVTDFDLDWEHRKLLDLLKVQVLTTPFDHRPPEGFAQRFQSSLYLLDALELLGNRASLTIVDPDLICRSNLEQLHADVGDQRVGLMPVAYGPDHDINGLSRRSSAFVATEMTGKSMPITNHYGGELIVLGSDVKSRVTEQMLSCYEQSLGRFASDKLHFVTEEHLLSFVAIAFDVDDLSYAIRRIWTNPLRRDVRPEDGQYLMWHLPAEKSRGFQVLYAELQNERSWFWQNDDVQWRNRVAKSVGMRRSPQRWVTEFAQKQLGRLRVSEHR